MDYNFNFKHPTIKKLHCTKIRNNKPEVLFQGLPKDVRPIQDALQTTPFKYRNLILVGRMSNCSPPFETDYLGKSDNSVVLYDVITVLLENISNNLCLPVYIFGVLLRGVGYKVFSLLDQFKVKY